MDVLKVVLYSACIVLLFVELYILIQIQSYIFSFLDIFSVLWKNLVPFSSSDYCPSGDSLKCFYYRALFAFLNTDDVKSQLLKYFNLLYTLSDHISALIALFTLITIAVVVFFVIQVRNGYYNSQKESEIKAEKSKESKESEKFQTQTEQSKESSGPKGILAKLKDKKNTIILISSYVLFFIIFVGVIVYLVLVFMTVKKYTDEIKEDCKNVDSNFLCLIVNFVPNFSDTNFYTLIALSFSTLFLFTATTIIEYFSRKINKIKKSE